MPSTKLPYQLAATAAMATAALAGAVKPAAAITPAAASTAPTTAGTPTAAATAGTGTTSPTTTPAAPATTAQQLSWSTAQPATSPPYLAYAAGAYDPTNSTFVLFGGIGPAGLSSATWVWQAGDWHQMTGTGGPQPPARDLASMAFDSQLEEFILFGGQGQGGTLLDDTWAWNGASWNCLQVCGDGVTTSTPGKVPPARDGATLTYDSAGDLLLFGGTGYATQSGVSGSGVPAAEITLDDTWEWAGPSAGWVQQDVAGPPARSGATAAYDPQNATTVLFGGESSPASNDGQPTLLDDTWIWNGHSWSQATPATPPPARFAAVADYYPALGGPMVTGGDAASGDLADCWLWRGGQWVKVAQHGDLPPRQGAAGGFDSADGQFVVFGGTSGGGTLDVTSLGTLSPAAPAPTTTTTTTTTTVAPTTPTTAHPAPVSTTTTVGTRPGTPPAKAPAKPTSTTTTPGSHPAAVVAPALEVGTSRVRRGGRLRVDGRGFAPGARVMLTLHSVPTLLGVTTADAGGGFSMDVSIPAATTAGVHRITATSSTSGGVVTAAAEVDVYPPGGVSSRTEMFLLGLVVLIPVATYLAMVGYGAARRRRITDRASAPRSPS